MDGRRNQHLQEPEAKEHQSSPAEAFFAGRHGGAKGHNVRQHLLSLELCEQVQCLANV